MSVKNGVSYNDCINYIRKRVSFAILHFALIALRGKRRRYHDNSAISHDEINILSQIRWTLSEDTHKWTDNMNLEDNNEEYNQQQTENMDRETKKQKKDRKKSSKSIWIIWSLRNWDSSWWQMDLCPMRCWRRPNTAFWWTNVTNTNTINFLEVKMTNLFSKLLLFNFHYTELEKWKIFWLSKNYCQ